MSNELLKGWGSLPAESNPYIWGGDLDNTLAGVDVQREVQPEGAASVDRHATGDTATTSQTQQQATPAYLRTAAAYVSDLLSRNAPPRAER